MNDNVFIIQTDRQGSRTYNWIVKSIVIRQKRMINAFWEWSLIYLQNIVD